MTRFPLVALLLIAGWVAGCSSAGRGPYQSTGEEHRDPAKAEDSYHRAIGLMAEHPDQAEALLRDALGLDLYHGAAHNNLGVLLLKQGRLYDAAEEFEWARKLLPGSPEPRVNLAIALTRGGKHRDAIEVAKAALETSPGNLPATQALAFIQLNEGLADASTREYLDTIIARDGDPVWRSWAQRWRTSLDQRDQADSRVIGP